jgi:hypothetical protein
MSKFSKATTLTLRDNNTHPERMNLIATDVTLIDCLIDRTTPTLRDKNTHPELGHQMASGLTTGSRPPATNVRSASARRTSWTVKVTYVSLLTACVQSAATVAACAGGLQPWARRQLGHGHAPSATIDTC